MTSWKNNGVVYARGRYLRPSSADSFPDIVNPLLSINFVRTRYDQAILAYGKLNKPGWNNLTTLLKSGVDALLGRLN